MGEVVVLHGEFGSDGGASTGRTTAETVVPPGATVLRRADGDGVRSVLPERPRLLVADVRFDGGHRIVELVVRPEPGIEPLRRALP